MPYKRTILGSPKEAFSEQFLTEQVCSLCEEHFINLKNLFFHYKEPFVQWKISIDVKGSSMPIKNLYI